MKGNFDACLAETLIHEGGFSDHPRDPGGRTMRGVTQRTYDAWRGRQGMPPADVKNVSPAELSKIYRGEYWDKVRGDELPKGVDLAVFDFAVNSGVPRAVRTLQELVGADVDGIIGPKTLDLAKRYEGRLHEDICDERLRFLRRLTTWPSFGKGWQTRVSDIRNVSGRMVKK